LGLEKTLSPTKTDEPIEMPFEGKTHAGEKDHVLDVGAHWSHLAHTIERSVRGGDAALCQLTLTIVIIFISSFHTHSESEQNTLILSVRKAKIIGSSVVVKTCFCNLLPALLARIITMSKLAN